ncbi:MAG: hypothetical protein JW896_15445 [Deltaproteobacteria bacterium]|nr:hypothetical protein [Deltaproteobacteria bacterium]
MIDYDVKEWSAEVSKENHRGWQSPDGIGKIIYEERFDVSYYDVQEELRG